MTSVRRPRWAPTGVCACAILRAPSVRHPARVLARRERTVALIPVSFAVSCSITLRTSDSNSSSEASLRITWSARRSFSAWSSCRSSRPARPALASLTEAGVPQLVVGDDGHGGVEGVLHRGLEEQRDLDDRDRHLGVEALAPFEHVRADPRMGDALEPGELVAVVEDDLAHLLAIDLPAGSDLLAPAVHQRRAHLVVLEQVVGDLVGRQGGRAVPLERGQRLGLTRPDAPGEPYEPGQPWAGGGSSD